MKAFILAAGIGKRLRPYTKNIPKCLIKINGVPLLDIWVDKLLNAGIKKIYINTFYLSEKLEGHINKSTYKKKIRLIKETKLHGTAGSLYRNIKYFLKEEKIILLHGDNYSLEPIENFINFHNKYSKNKDLTIMSFKTKYPSQCGIIKKNKKNCMIAYHEKKKKFHGYFANSAIYVLNKKFIVNYKKKHSTAFDFSNDIIPHYINKANVFHSKKKFDDIGTVQIYKKYI